MATAEDLMQSIVSAVGEMRLIEVEESTREALTKIDTDLWDLVESEQERRDEEA